jgi:pimeloyl-ACP methyl ester carboxylesterase
MVKRAQNALPNLGQLRGALKIATNAALSVSRISEGVHQAVLETAKLSKKTPAKDKQAKGITGLVYRSVELGTKAVGKTLDSILAAASAMLPADMATGKGDAPESARGQAILAALNGVMGDQLVATNNPLATQMSIRFRGHVITAQAMPAATEVTPKVVLLIHGLCMNDLQWRVESENPNEPAFDHGSILQSQLGYTPIYLRYNTGLPIAVNGQALADLLEPLLAAWPVKITDFSVLVHSMGGLVMRQACLSAQEKNLAWLVHVKRLVFLGTPHFGAPLEQAGYWIDRLLATNRFSVPFTKLTMLRSAGINDLRDGISKEIPWPFSVNCFAVAATTAAKRSLTADRLVGDGLVPLLSALGSVPKENQWIAYRTNHMQLLHSAEVSQQVLRWLVN